MEFIEWVSEDQADEREAFWIRQLKLDGVQLLNKQLLPSVPTASLKISTDLHRRLKIHAVQNGFRLQDFIERVLEKSLNRKRP
jgi:predicted DNA binding CopG/RHH family protein